MDNRRIIEALSPEETPLYPGGFHVLITTERHKLGPGTDVVLGPNFEFGVEVAKLEDLLFTEEKCDDGDNSGCENREIFVDTILKKMQVGGSGSTKFARRSADGQEEQVYFTYAPITVKSFRAIDPSNITRGVEEYEITPYSLALGEPQSAIFSTFEEIEDPLDFTVTISMTVMSVMIVVAFGFVALISSRAARSIVVPVAQLLTLIQNINRFDITEDLPEIQDGSVEVSKVRDTFERLYMVVRFANTAFFSGELVKAYETLNDALELFTKLNNPKAMGVANNNLGNTMLTVYRALNKTGIPSICGLSKEKAVSKGIDYFNAAIDAGEKALAKINDEEGWSTNYLIFMQQLSNRYFNRAIFLMTVKKDHPNPMEAERQGVMDLSTTKDMDREVVDNGDQQGFKGDRDVYFDLLLSRIKGILLLVSLGYEDEWGLDELFDDARRELVNAMKDPSSNVLFRHVEPAGQMQRLDSALIQYYRVGEEKDVHKAAEVAIRMMYEDDYVLGEAASIAIKALIDFCDNATAEELNGEDPSDAKATLFQYKRHVSETLQLSHQGSGLMGVECFRQSHVGDFSMEDF